jgi:hypothetical protein
MMSGIKHFIRQGHAEGVDGAVICEPEENQLCVAQKGAMRGTLAELIDDLADRADGPTEAADKGADRGADRGADTAAPGDECAAEGACSPLPVLPAPSRLPEAWTREGAVLCVSGRGFLDAAAAAILAQILAKRGVGVRIVPFAETASARLARLDPGTARLSCVVSIAHGGEPGHLNRLVARLRQRMPAVPVLAGVWLSDERRPALILNVDRRADSLREAVETVIEAAEAESGPAPQIQPETGAAAPIPAAIGQGT